MSVGSGRRIRVLETTTEEESAGILGCHLSSRTISVKQKTRSRNIVIPIEYGRDCAGLVGKNQGVRGRLREPRARAWR